MAAGPFDFSDPTAGLAQAGNSFMGFMDDPQGRAALLSAGLALMQPPSFGDTAVSQIGRAIGAAGQSATANEATDMKRQELESKQDLRTSQAGLAESRAQTAGAHADTAAQRMALEREKLGALGDRQNLQNRVRLSIAYQNYVKDAAKRNQEKSLLGGGPAEPILPINDWVQANPMLRNMGLVPDAGTGDETAIPPESPSTTTSAAPKSMPSDKTQLVANQVYQTPRGAMRWTGTGFVPP